MRVLCAALCVAVFACLFSFRVGASEPQVGSGLVCDTKEQAAIFASTVADKGVQAAIAAINADAGQPHACVIAEVLFVIVEKLDSVTIGDKPFVIAKILVGGVRTATGLQPVAPQEFYTILNAPAEGRPA